MKSVDLVVVSTKLPVLTIKYPHHAQNVAVLVGLTRFSLQNIEVIVRERVNTNYVSLKFYKEMGITRLPKQIKY